MGGGCASMASGKATANHADQRSIATTDFRKPDARTATVRRFAITGRNARNIAKNARILRKSVSTGTFDTSAARVQSKDTGAHVSTAVAHRSARFAADGHCASTAGANGGASSVVDRLAVPTVSDAMSVWSVAVLRCVPIIR